MTARMAEVEAAKDLECLPQLDLDQLRFRWSKVYGRDAPARLSRLLLIGGLAYRLQENAKGGLSTNHRMFLDEVAAGKPVPAPVTQYKPGTVFLREWHGATHEVTALQKGFMYRDKQYASLTSLARLISGVHRSGPKFFGLLDHATQ